MECVLFAGDFWLSVQHRQKLKAGSKAGSWWVESTRCMNYRNVSLAVSSSQSVQAWALQHTKLSVEPGDGFACAM